MSICIYRFEIYLKGCVGWSGVGVAGCLLCRGRCCARRRKRLRPPTPEGGAREPDTDDELVCEAHRVAWRDTDSWTTLLAPRPGRASAEAASRVREEERAVSWEETPVESRDDVRPARWA